MNPTSVLPLTTEEEPALDIRLGFSRNPLRWLLLVARILAYLFLVVLTSGFVPSFPCCGLLPLALVMFLFIRFLTAAFGIDRSRYRFFDDRLVIDHRAPGPMPRRRRVYDYRDIRHLELTSMKKLKLCLARPNEVPLVVEIAVDARMGEDYFDAMVDHVQTAAPGHLFSIHENGFVRYSQECLLEDLFPNDLVEVSKARATGSVLTADEHEYRFEEEVLFALEGDDTRRLFRTNKSFVTYPNGMVIATVKTPAYREIDIDLFNEDMFRIRGAEQDVLRNDEPIGRIANHAGDSAIEWSPRLPAAIALIVLTTVIESRLTSRL